MALTVGENSYVSASEADTYFGDRYGYEAWSALTPEQKDAALISAADLLDSMCNWYGRPVDSEQTMAFPRTPGADPVPQSIKNAQCEIAFTVISSSGAATSSGGTSPQLTRMKADVVEFEWSDTGQVKGGFANEYAKSLLNPYGECHYLSSTGTKIVDVARA